MIVVDTSVWIDLMRSAGSARTLWPGRVDELLLHDFVLGELSLGNFRDRRSAFQRLEDFDRAPVAPQEIVRELIEGAPLYGTGIGYVDAHLLASTLLVDGGTLWTRDRRLRSVAQGLDILAELE